jgi:AraC family transcriptional regulator, positive regulator of tynA and feaB
LRWIAPTRRLAREFPAIKEAETSAVLDPVLSLLSATLVTRRPPSKASRGHQDSFRSFCRTIERNLSESELTPAAVAADHDVSLRYLHLVFAEQGTTFGKFLRRTRLARCHRELSQLLPGKTLPKLPSDGVLTIWPISVGHSKRSLARRREW